MYSATEYKPYFYIIGWSKHEIFYCGIEFGKSKKIANPNNLWKTYFTSSDYVQQFRRENGEPDIIEIVEIFENKNQALEYEEKFITEHVMTNQHNWLNRNNSGKRFYHEATQEFREKQREMMMKRLETGWKPKVKTGVEHHNYGKKWTAEQKSQMSEKKKGKSINISMDEKARRRSQARINGKKSSEKMKEKIWVFDNKDQTAKRINLIDFDSNIHVKGRPSYNRKNQHAY